MNPAEMIVAIVIIVTIGKVLQARFKAQGSHAARPGADTAETLRMREEVRTLRERVQVLERVITENNRSIELDREIERLRDDNRV